MGKLDCITCGGAGFYAIAGYGEDIPCERCSGWGVDPVLEAAEQHNGPMTLAEQMVEIGEGMRGIDMLNIELRRGVHTVFHLAALAFDDDEDAAEQVDSALLNWITPLYWPHVKAQLEGGISAARFSEGRRAEWRTAVEAVYRMAGVEDVPAATEGMF